MEENEVIIQEHEEDTPHLPQKEEKPNETFTERSSESSQRGRGGRGRRGNFRGGRGWGWKRQGSRQRGGRINRIR